MTRLALLALALVVAGLSGLVGCGDVEQPGEADAGGLDATREAAPKRDAAADVDARLPTRDAGDATTTIDSATTRDSGTDAGPEGGICKPITCEAQGVSCGTVPDYCGHMLTCNTCIAPEVCGGGGNPYACAVPCVPTTCAAVGAKCGPTPDGCGNVLPCGECPADEGCGTGGVPGECSSCLSGACIPLDCADQNIDTGPASDGCGNVIECGTGCPQLDACIGTVTNPPPWSFAFECLGSAECLPLTCADLGATCGRVSDGCGNTIECGACPESGVCPGDGGTCGSCIPKTCASQGLNCGPQPDGCGGTLECGTCETCIPCSHGVCQGVFVSACVPGTCESLGVACGGVSDGCGGLLDCGACAAGLTCAQGACLAPCDAG